MYWPETPGKNILWRGKGNDLVEGRENAKKLLGRKGKDVLDGGARNDFLTGQGSKGTIVFSKNYGHDTVLRFENGIDKIRLDDALWKGNLTRVQVLNTFGTVIDGDVVLDFGNDELVMAGIDDLSLLRNYMEIV